MPLLDVFENSYFVQKIYIGDYVILFLLRSLSKSTKRVKETQLYIAKCEEILTFSYCIEIKMLMNLISRSIFKEKNLKGQT